MSENPNTDWWTRFTEQLRKHWLEIAISGIGTTIGLITLADQIGQHHPREALEGAPKVLSDLSAFAKRMGGH